MGESKRNKKLIEGMEKRVGQKYKQEGKQQEEKRQEEKHQEEKHQEEKHQEEK